MTQDQTNRKAVIDNVISHFENHNSIWASIPPITESVTALKSVRQELELGALVQADGSSSGATAKNLALEMCAEKGYLLGRRICAWARKNGRAEILQAVDFSDSDLRYGAEDDRLTRFALLIKYATENKTELTAYKVNDAAIEDLQTALNTVTTLRGKGQEQRNHRIYSTASIDESLSKSVKIFELLDDEVEALIDNKEFIDTYFIARRKTDRRATRAKAEQNGQAQGA